MRESGRTKAMLGELVIVALFLALSAMTLLRLFAASNTISRESEALARATILAQDSLERFSAGEELPAREECILDGVAYSVLAQIESSETGAGTLETCTVTVQQGQDTVTSMQTACYRPERSAP